ncbi:uncharacterized protein LOC143191021 isoform X3 [Rhynchophorus ferrugineus]|uniref:uncharacterized protein LOC143191021 isoform X3 n=1 Tax=Rhynchophorus ferrugineus TaxID=354439 RepID=UPI003FCD5D8F
MDDISSALDPNELMDLDEHEPYEIDDDEDDIQDESVTSPFQHLSSGPASAATSVASSPPMADDFPTPFNFTGKPLAIKRGRGRPRREGGKPPPKRGSGGVPRVRRPKSIGLSRYRGSRSVRQPDRMDFELPMISPSSLDDMSLPDSDGYFFHERERPIPAASEENPYGPETWPGKVCAFCNLGERSQLGQGEMLRLNCPEGFTPQRILTNEPNNQIPPQAPEKDSGDKSPRGPVTCRRMKNFSKARNMTSTNEHIDELSIIGYTEPPSISILYEPTGQFYVHRNCALWSNGVSRTEHQALENVGPVVLKSSSTKCSLCNHYGASLTCKVENCNKVYHFPCATASCALQELSSLSTYCNSHLGEAAIRGEVSVCCTCKSVGDIANLVYCSSCGAHYHGGCVGVTQTPGARAGWQCRKCRMCQVCRVIGDETKLMTCEQCDKVYHASCQRPIVTSVPKYGWKCKCCRICGDCGSRTPGAGLSSRWHLHYTVCDSCYQQRNKGCCCPVCQRAYRSHAHREMIQCTKCRKFVHGSCDPEADLLTYKQKKESTPDYEYVCIACKTKTISSVPGRQISSKRSSTDEPGDFSASQESFYDDMSEFDTIPSEEGFRSIGLGKGKPFASKIGKKRLSYSTGKPGRPKGSFGKGKGIPGKQGFMKRQRIDFGRKRGPKAKMRGVFGAPGVGLSRPISDGKGDDEPGGDNRLVLCSAKDKFILTQDVCVMCGALGTDQEGCLISCVQCGQCYHPYCVNVKVTKVILQKGWRCLDCTVCEGCGQRDDEGRLILCDDCDVSYHTYCMDPPLEYVPDGTWKCKWCACCQTCGSADPGFNSSWINGFTECGPCASHVTCPCCCEPYSEGDIIIKCSQCERWLHGSCDLIKTEQDAEKCAEEGYCCVLCRPRDILPPHLVPPPVNAKPPTPTKSPEARSIANFVVDGVCLSEAGNNLIKSLSMEQHGTRKKRKKLPTVQDKEAGIMATIESVIAGGNAGENSLEDTKLELVDMKDEPQEIYKEGMIWTKEDGSPPEGFTIFTLENGISVLRRKRQRNLQKLGIGGFLVRMRGLRTGQDNDDIDTLPGQTTPTSLDSPMPLASVSSDGDKPKKKPIRRKMKSKLSETFPPYLQEAFFGKELMDITDTKKMESGSSDDEKEEKYNPTEELMTIDSKPEKPINDSTIHKNQQILEEQKDDKSNLVKDEEDDSTEDLKDVLALPGDLLDADLVNSIINEEDDDLTKNTELEALGDEGELSQTLGSTENSKDAKDEFSEILGSHFGLESIPNINSKDVEDIFKGVLTDESQESQLSQEANIFPNIQTNTSPMFPIASSQPSPASIQQMSLTTSTVQRPTALPGVQHVSFPPSPYHSEYSNSPQFSPAFSEPPSPWVGMNDNAEIDSTSVGVPTTYNQRSSEKMKADEGLGSGATISAVLYANINHPEWKTEYPAWSDRYKQIIKKWRTLTQELKGPFLQKARDNRSQLRMKKQQQSQTAKDSSTPSPATGTKPPAPVPALANSLPSTGSPSSTQAPAPTSEDQEKIVQQQKSAREAENERRWKQLQAMRQQQAQQQHHVLQEQRVQENARVQRINPEPSINMQNNQTSPLHVSTNSQDPSPVASPSPVSRQFVGMKSPTFAHPSPQPTNIRTPTPSQSPVHEFPPQNPPSQVPEPLTPDYVQNSQQQKPGPFVKGPGVATNEPFQVQKQQFPPIRPPMQIRPDQPEVTRQLRDLLQRQQQVKNFSFGTPEEKPGQRTSESEIPPASTPSATDTTFRQPLPPGAARPRIPMAIGNRPGMNVRMQQLDGRLQGLDPRTRLLLQQQRLSTPMQQQIVNNSTIRYTAVGGNRPTTIEPYEQLLHQRQALQTRTPTFDQNNPRVSLVQGPMQRPPTVVSQPSALAGNPPNQGESATEQEIPDNVTAELEKLEQETGTMAELQGVSEILGGLGDDDDELLAEMGADFNILEYADPELEALAGEKTNILDLDLEEDHLRQERKKEMAQQKQTVTTTETPVARTTPSVTPSEKPKPPSEQIPPSVPLKEPMPAKTPTPTQSETLLSQHPTVPHMPPAQPQPPQKPSSIPITKPQASSSSNIQQPSPQQPQFSIQQIQQQMLHQVGCKMSKYVQQAAAQGNPMPPGAKLQTPEGIVGIVLANNNVQLQVPPNLQQRLIQQLQSQKLQMRMGQQNPRMMSPVANRQHQGIPAQTVGPRPRMALPPTPQLPPPPYPGPPPPYPGNVIPQQPNMQNQMGLRMGPSVYHHMGHAHSMAPQPYPGPPPFHRRTLLLEDQPLIIEDLLQEEKREQEKQRQSQANSNDEQPINTNSESALLSDHDFDRLTADVFNNSPVGINRPNQGNAPLLPHWQQNRVAPPATPQPTTEITTRTQMFNANVLPAPPLPPENIVTEQDKQAQLAYEQWLNHQNNVLNQQLKYYEAEVQKLRKSRKSLNSKQRQLRKSGNQLSEADSIELQRISAEQAILQKHLESSRKQCRQHGMLIQEYRNKQQLKNPTVTGTPSPLGPPTSSPIHHQSPQHSSPMHSPGPVIAHSPGPASVAALLQSPGGNVSPMQPSRIGTPLSQGEGSPGPVQSPSQMGLLPPVPRMTSPQHRRVVTSPVGYAGDMRGNTSQMRFVRASVDHGALQQRIRNQTPSPMQAFSPKPGTPSPLNSPPLNQVPLTQQQLLQKQLHQQENIQGDGNIHSNRVAQLIQHRNLSRQQSQQQLTPQQHQMLVQQQLAKQQQQQQQTVMQLHARLNQQQQQQQVNPPQSPMPPKSPLHSQSIMSPHSMPASPMPPKSPMLNFNSNQSNMPNSPASRSPFHQNQPPNSPMMHQYQTPSSPMINSPHAIRRPPSASSSPAMPERPTSVENPSTPRTPYNIDGSHIQESMHTGGGNPNNPSNPIPRPPLGFEYCKLGLRGGAPMWAGFNRGEKRVPTPPTGSDGDKSLPGDSVSLMKNKKELHLNKVSILKKKTLPKGNVKNIGMKTQSDYDYDESSSTPPVTPPPSVSTRIVGQKTIPKTELVTEIVDYEDDNSTVLSSEVSLSSAAQQNDDELEMTETLSQNDIAEVLSSPLEADQISDDYLLFHENIDISSSVQYSDKEEVEEEYTDIVIRSPTTSDDEFIMQGRTKKYNILDITEAVESPDQDIATEPSTEPEDEDLTQAFEESEVVVIDQPVKSPEEQISTKEDFEELIDEGTRKEKLLKADPKHVADFHKYAAPNVFTFPPKGQTATIRPANVIGTKLPQKISLITPLIQNFSGRGDVSKTNLETQQLILTPSTKITTTGTPKLTSIILTHNPVRSNILSVGPKLVSSPSITIVSASSQIASILPSKFTVPVISASAVRQLPNVKVIDKPSSSLSLTTPDKNLPKKLFEDGSVSPDSSINESIEEKTKMDSTHNDIKLFMKNNEAVLKTESVDQKLVPMAETVSHTAVQNKVGHIITKDKLHKITKPIVTKTAPPVIIHHGTPELKMTAQVIQEPTTHMQITATETMSTFDGSSEDNSVVISIPSPTPSQEQMLDNIALQALETRRRDLGYQDVLDMFANMENLETPEPIGEKKTAKSEPENTKEPVSHPMAINVANLAKQSVPQLSPLSQPTELTTNMANASQQLRTLLSLQTSTNSQTSNVETTGKSNNQKILNNSCPVTASPVVTARIIQKPERQSPVTLTTASTVIVPNIVKQKVACSSPNKITLQTTRPTVSSVPNVSESFVSNRIVPVTSDQSKLLLTTSAVATTSKPSSNINSEINKKGSLTLTAMLQNQPAATPTTKPSADTITAASLLATPVSLSPTRFSAALAQAQPNAIIAAAAAALSSSSATSNASSNSVITSSFKTITSTTNLLHTQLTKARTKSLDDIKDLKEDLIKIETSEPESEAKQEFSTMKYSTPTSRGEDSQNVLLKKLLQNTACASTQSPPPSSATTITTLASSNEAQKSSPPTLSSLLPPVIKTEPPTSTVTTQTRPTLQRMPIRETSFVSSPALQQSPTSSGTSSTMPTQQLHIDVKKCAPPSRSSSRDDLLSPPTPRSSCSQDSSLQTPPLVIKKEFSSSQSNGTDVKKELLDDTSQHSEVSDQGKGDIHIKEEMDVGDVNLLEKSTVDKEELKKQKRRMYNQKRRQNQILNKDVNKPNKRPRKNSKLEEDYDSYIDGVLAQLRQLPPMAVSEPLLVRNYGAMAVFGSGDLSKIGTKSYDSRIGDLKGTYGDASLPGFSDFYSTKPYGDDEPLPEVVPVSTQRGFYDQEFPLIRFDTADDKKFDLFSREDTPDSIVSSSSTEHIPSDFNDKYLGLRLISDEEDEDENLKNRLSPDITIVKPIPIRLKPAGLFLKDPKLDADDKENACKELKQEKLRPGSAPATPMKENENIKVTLTLTSRAAEDIVEVLRDLANILQIPPPATYQIVDRTSSASGQKLGMYRTKGKDGKEGTPIDIQSILNGAAKFCKHCDVVILDNMIKKKVSDLPLLSKDSDLLGEGEEVYFCSSTCYMQFALMHRSPSISEDKAAAIIDHLSQKDTNLVKMKPTPMDVSEQKPVMNKQTPDVRDIKSEEPSSYPISSYFQSSIKQNNKMTLAKSQEPPRIQKNISYKFWTPGCLQPNQKHKRLSDKEITEMLYQMGITVAPSKIPEDTRKCMFCQVVGDGVADGPARLLNFDVDKWVHLNCALWSNNVYEAVNGSLVNLDIAIQHSSATICVHCNKPGATISCFKTRCCNVYHLSCAVRDNCVFFKNKTIFCAAHVPKNEKDNELTTLSVSRRVYVNRDENRQVATVMHHTDTNNLLRVGSLIFLNVGQLLPHQLQNFHTSNYIYPIGYKIVRFYWSMRHHNKRCRYICSIHDSGGRPEFKVVVQETAEEDVQYRDTTPKGAWNPILEKIAALRRENKCVQMFPQFISGEDLFGLTEPAVVRVLESLPGIDTLTDYKFKYGRNPLLELPLAINPSGAARTEPRLRHQTHWKRPHTHRTTGSSRPAFGPSATGPTTPTSIGEIVCPYSKQFVHSKSSQYKKMKQEWRNNVYLARSKIQGLGLYAAKDLEKYTMVIEYIGEVIRTELSECREKQYEAKNRGIYMFRLDDDRVVDATLSGGLARYINHSCNPNCVAETVEIDRDLKIIIFAKRRIQRGEELAYDYKFDIEDDQHKISCMCGAPNCRKWMN